MKYIQNNKEQGTDWFKLDSDKEGIKFVFFFLFFFFFFLCSKYQLCFFFRWFGKCWVIHNFLKYEFDFEFEV